MGSRSLHVLPDAAQVPSSRIRRGRGRSGNCLRCAADARVPRTRQDLAVAHLGRQASRMPVFVAMLRGVHGGRVKRIPMAYLRALLSKLDYTRVATVLNSGNAVFCATRRSSATHARSIAAAIAGTLGIEVPVVVKSAREFASIVAENPLG